MYEFAREYAHILRIADWWLRRISVLDGVAVVATLAFPALHMFTLVAGIAEVLFLVLMLPVWIILHVPKRNPGDLPFAFLNLPLLDASDSPYQVIGLDASSLVMEPDHPAALKPFVELASRYGLDLAYEMLTKQARYQLYGMWACHNPNAFLSLRKGNKTVAVSILLPLTESGYRRIHSCKVHLTDFPEEAIAEPGAPCYGLLWDTLVICPEVGYDRRGGRLHVYSEALIAEHIAKFWDTKHLRAGVSDSKSVLVNLRDTLLIFAQYLGQPPQPLRVIAEIEHRGFERRVREVFGFSRIGIHEITKKPMLEVVVPDDARNNIAMRQRVRQLMAYIILLQQRRKQMAVSHRSAVAGGQ